MPLQHLLDGGTGHLLKQWGVLQQVPGLPFEQQFLAGCLALQQQPDLVLRAHTAYVQAGCDVLTTNSFVATLHSLGKVQRGAEHLPFCERAGRLARQAADASPDGRKVLVAGSLPPLQESYQTANLPDAVSMQAQYADIARALQPHVDVFLAETLSTVAEAQAALAAAAAVDPTKPVWLSFTLEDSIAACLRDKQPLASALQQVQGHHPKLAALLVNCCAPAAVTAAMPVLKQHAPAGVLVGCYANGFQKTTTQWITGSDAGVVQSAPGDYDAGGIITPEAYLRHAQAWASAGADVIGGCCGVGPQHMQLLASRLLTVQQAAD